MTISEIKELTRFLNDEDIDKIKKEIKSKEDILKSGNIGDEEMVQVLNTLFAILVIEKTLDSEIEEVEGLRDILEQELLESYNTYDSYIEKSKKEDKKKKKRWLLDFLFLSEKISAKKAGIGSANKLLTNLKEDLDNVKEKKSDSNLKEVVKDKDKVNRFSNGTRKYRNPNNRENEVFKETICKCLNKTPATDKTRTGKEINTGEKKEINVSTRVTGGREKTGDSVRDPEPFSENIVNKIR